MKLFATTVAVMALVAATAAAQCDKSGLSVTVSPASAVPGQPVSVTITNTTSNCTYTLPSSCVYRSVHESGLSGVQVLSVFCASVLTPIGPGKSKTQIWDQRDDFGGQVIDGSYVFRIDVYDPGFNKLLYTPAVAISGCASPQVIYGPRSAGTGGFEPQMGYVKSPHVGSASYYLVIADAVGGAPALLLVGTGAGSLPTPWGTFLLNPLGPLFSLVLPLPGTPGAGGQGHLLINAPIPNIPALVGVSGFLQTLIADPASTGGISHTNGLQVTICP